MKKKLSFIIISLIFSIIYFLYNSHLLSYSHFDEDAYILFRYADMFNKGYGITFYPNAVPIEGATDFLWLVCIIATSKLGLDIGTSAVILNSIGVFGITYIFILLLSETIKNNFILFPICFMWILFFPLVAALGGFSVLFYCFFIVLMLYLIDRKEKFYLSPFLALTLGLIRPDGVIIGVFIVLITFFLANKKQYKKIIINSFISVLIGLAYFTWRYEYFGNLLPLPLYVKSSERVLNNVFFNFKQSLEYKQFYLYFIGFIISLLVGNKNLRKKFILLSIPFFIHYLSFLISKQSQNIGFRFQAPIIIFFIYSSISILSKTQFQSTSIKNFSLFVVTFIISVSSIKTINYITYYFKPSKSLTSLFAYKLSTEVLTGKETIALTEAGRLAYYQQKENPIIDLVGLNTEYVAKNNLDQKYLESQNPHLLFFWGQNDFAKNKSSHGKLAVKFTNKSEFIPLFKFKNILDLKNDKTKSKITVSMKQSILFLYNNWEKYDVYFINLDQNNRFDYVYAFSKNFNQRKNSIDKLFENMYKEKPLSYYELEKLLHENK